VNNFVIISFSFRCIEKTGARGWRDAGDCSSDDDASGDDGGGVGDGDGRAGNAGGSGRGLRDATAA